MSTYIIKLEDKAAFINHLDKLDVDVNSYKIKDNKLKGAFEFTVDDPEVNNIVKTVLRKNPKINTIKEMKSKLTKEKLAEIIREELADMKKDKKKKLQEMDPSWMDIAQGVGTLGAVFAGAMGIVKAGLASIKRDLRKDPKYQGMSDEELEQKAANIFKGSLDQTLGKNVDMDRWK